MKKTKSKSENTESPSVSENSKKPFEEMTKEEIIEQYLLYIRGDALEPEQIDALNCEDKDIYMAWSRKKGKSELMTLKIVVDGRFNPRWFIGLISAGQRQGGEVYHNTLGFLNFLGAKFESRPTVTEFTLKNGYRVLSLPTGYTGATNRTYSFDKMYWDEAAYINDKVRKAMKPCMLKRGKQEIVGSSAHGARGWFYDELFNKKGTLATICDWTTIKHIPRERLEKLIEEERALYGERYVAQEYGVQFLGGVAGLIDEILINQTKTNISYEDANKGDLFLGITAAPLGKSGIYIALCRGSYDRVKIVDLKILDNNSRTLAIIEAVQELAAHSRISKIITSETTLGTGALDTLCSVFGKSKVLSVESLTYDKDQIAEGRRTKVREKDLYDHLVTCMERKTIQIAENQVIIDALKSLDYDYKKDNEQEIVIFGRGKIIAEAVVYSLVPHMLGLNRKLWIKGGNLAKPLLQSSYIR